MATTLVSPAAATTRAAPPEHAAGRIRPLNNGDQLSRAEFHRTYEAHPEIKVAELVEGTVYVAPPVRFAEHGSPHGDLVTWSGVYSAASPGVDGADGATVFLDLDNELQPDLVLRLAPEHGGKSRISDDGYIDGAPELVAEISASTVSYDMHQKLRVYQRSGVQEYIVAQAYEQRVDWFALREGVYEPMAPDDRGILRSEVFPGLWLQADAVWTGALAAMLAVLQEGLASPEHAAFVERLGAT